MAVQLTISYETLLELVTQLPQYQQQTLLNHLQQSNPPDTAPHQLNLHPGAMVMSDEFWLGQV